MFGDMFLDLKVSTVIIISRGVCCHPVALISVGLKEYSTNLVLYLHKAGGLTRDGIKKAKSKIS